MTNTDTLYLATNPRNQAKYVPLALTIPNDLPPITIKGYTLSWSKDALEILDEIQSELKSNQKNLPYVSLRNLLETELDHLIRVEFNVGLSKYKISQKEVKAFAYLSLEEGDVDSIDKKLRSILDTWMTQSLRPFLIKEKVNSELIDEQLEDLRSQHSLITVQGFDSKILPWKQSPKTGTTHRNDAHSFPMLVNYLARQIAGKEVFNGLGTMKRIIGSYNLTGGQAELITNPISLKGSKGKFSLVITLEIVTFPSVEQPILKIDVSKRRWFNKLDNPTTKENKISGYIFSDDYSDRVFSYQLLCQKQENKKWTWNIDKGFDILQKKLNLPMIKVLDGQKISQGEANTESCQVMLNFRYGLNKKNKKDKHDIKSGVPELDKLEALQKVSEILQDIGMIPWENSQQYEVVETNHSSQKNSVRQLKGRTLFYEIINRLNTEHQIDFSKKVDLDLLQTLLLKYFHLNIEDIVKYKQFFTKDKQQQELQSVKQDNQSILTQLYPHEKPQLVILYYPDLRDTIDLKILKETADILWGDVLEIHTYPCPQNTHGSRDSLPEKDKPNKQRSQARVKAWESLANQLAAQRKQTFCLIFAPEWYENKPDDKVNKPSTRNALASIAGASVQFLFSIERTKDNHLNDFSDFFYRIQSALKDLLLAHSAFINYIPQKVAQYFPNNPPKEIIGITIVRKQKGRSRGKIEASSLPIAIRTNTETGKSKLCFYTENNHQIEWFNFSDGLSKIASITPIKIGKDAQTRKRAFMMFVDQIITNAVKDDNQPVVIIDSSNCSKLWSWLTDAQINVNDINMQVSRKSPYVAEKCHLRWKGSRIIRIRQELAPNLINNKQTRLYQSSLEDHKNKNALKSLQPDQILDTPTSPLSTLFKIITHSSTQCVPYLSIGNNSLQQEKRGLSCYQETELTANAKSEDDSDNLKNAKGETLYKLVKRPAFKKQYPTPNPLEIVVTLRQENDDCDRLAEFVESLRYNLGHYGESVSLPAVIFFERVVRDYISEFTIDEDESENND
ncbi:MAG: RNaseH domain-containing protein [Microcystaceae cyanobacterium]